MFKDLWIISNNSLQKILNDSEIYLITDTCETI